MEGRINTYIHTSEGWVSSDGHLYVNLFFKDKLHLVEAGYTKLARSFIKTIQLIQYKIPKTHDSTSSTYKNVVVADDFISEESGFPSLKEN